MPLWSIKETNSVKMPVLLSYCEEIKFIQMKLIIYLNSQGKSLQNRMEGHGNGEGQRLQQSAIDGVRAAHVLQRFINYNPVKYNAHK
jgi:hypothetical protein